MQDALSTHIGVEYVFRRSLPRRFALIKTEPSAGIKYKQTKKAKRENPIEV
jgi:hypothetical protein